MNVRLTVIGSSPAWPNPGSAQSGYLLEADGTLLLDCGPGVLGRLRESGRLADLDAIAITHFHLDHWGDLVPWCWLAAYGRDTLPRPRLLVPPDGIRELERFAELWGNESMFQRAFELEEYAPNTPIEVAGFMLEARPVPHFELPSYGFRVTCQGRTLAYSGDSGPGPHLNELAEGAHLFLCEATLEAADRETTPRGHLAAEEAVAAATGPVLLTHRPIELGVPNGVPLARDGLVLEV